MHIDPFLDPAWLRVQRRIANALRLIGPDADSLTRANVVQDELDLERDRQRGKRKLEHSTQKGKSMPSGINLNPKFLDSSIWQESNTTRIVWITMLLTSDRNGYVCTTVEGLSKRSNVSMEACTTALTRMKAPDPWNTSTEQEGRHIAEVDGGWVVINIGQFL